MHRAVPNGGGIDVGSRPMTWSAGRRPREADHAQLGNGGHVLRFRAPKRTMGKIRRCFFLCRRHGSILSAEPETHTMARPATDELRASDAGTRGLGNTWAPSASRRPAGSAISTPCSGLRAAPPPRTPARQSGRVTELIDSLWFSPLHPRVQRHEAGTRPTNPMSRDHRQTWTGAPLPSLGPWPMQSHARRLALPRPQLGRGTSSESLLRWLCCWSTCHFRRLRPERGSCWPPLSSGKVE